TLYSISRMHGVSVEDLKAWNKLWDNNMERGAQLIVGKGATPTSTKPVYVPEADDEVSSKTEAVAVESAKKPATTAEKASTPTAEPATTTTPATSTETTTVIKENEV